MSVDRTWCSRISAHRLQSDAFEKFSLKYTQEMRRCLSLNDFLCSGDFQVSLSELESKNRELEGILQAKDAEVMALKHQTDQLTNDFLYNLKVVLNYCSMDVFQFLGLTTSQMLLRSPNHTYHFFNFALACCHTAS